MTFALWLRGIRHSGGGYLAPAGRQQSCCGSGGPAWSGWCRTESRDSKRTRQKPHSRRDMAPSSARLSPAPALCSVPSLLPPVTTQLNIIQISTGYEINTMNDVMQTRFYHYLLFNQPYEGYRSKGDNIHFCWLCTKTSISRDTLFLYLFSGVDFKEDIKQVWIRYIWRFMDWHGWKVGDSYVCFHQVDIDNFF